MASPEQDPVILSAVRTAFGKFQGALSGIPAPRLGAVAIRGAVSRAGIHNHASSTRSFFSFISTSDGAPTYNTATPPDNLAKRSCNFSLS